MGIQACGEWIQARAQDITTFAEPTVEVVKQGFATVQASYDWLDKQVVKLSEEMLPKSIAPIVQDAFRSLPVTLGWLFLPSNLVIGLAVGNAALHMIKGRVFCNQTYRNIYNGIGFATAFECANAIVNLAQTGKIVCGVAALISALTSGILFSQANTIPRA